MVSDLLKSVLHHVRGKTVTMIGKTIIRYYHFTPLYIFLSSFIEKNNSRRKPYILLFKNNEKKTSLKKFSYFAEKIVFWSTLEAPSGKTVYLQELVIVCKVVANKIVYIIQFDQNTVRSNVKELYKI